MDCSLPGSSVHGILQARILEWIAISFSRGSSWPRDQTQISCIAGRFFAIWAIGKSMRSLGQAVIWYDCVLIESENLNPEMGTHGWGVGWGTQLVKKAEIRLMHPLAKEGQTFQQTTRTWVRGTEKVISHSPQRNQPSHHLDLGLLASRTLRQYTSVV